jgi:hypothetical protein
MRKVDFAIVIQETISRCSQNRIGEKPPVFVTLAPVLTRVPWPDQSAEEFVRRFLYEALFTSDADAAVEVSLRRRALLDDLNAFVGISGSNMRLGIFGTIDAPNLKMVVSLEALRHRQKCDLLLPIADADPAPELLTAGMPN